MRDGTEGRGARGRESGLSLVEVLVAIGILSFLLLVVLQASMTVGDSSSAVESYNTVLVETQKVTAQLHEDVATARKLYEDDALGQTYLKFIDYGGLPLLSSSLLPLIEPLGEFHQDVVGDRRTGNVLLLVGEMSPFDFTAPSNGKDYRVSVFRLIAYYVADGGSPVAQGLSAFDLVRWESEAFADFTTLSSITDATARQEVVGGLVSNARINWAWDPTQTVDAAFFELTTDISPSPEPTFIIPPSNMNNRLPKGWYRFRNAAIAPNNSVTMTEAAVPKFAQKVPAAGPNPGFPHGFEVKVVGPSGARKIKVRVVAERMMRNRIMRSASETIATMRDI
jgi:hypothetical protein